MPQHDIVSWAIGIFEGEGSVTVVTTQNGHKQLQIRMCMVDVDVVDRFHAAVGVGRRGEQSQNGGKIIQRWACTKNADSKTFIRMMYPHLGIRRRQIIQDKLTITGHLDWLEGL